MTGLSPRPWLRLAATGALGLVGIGGILVGAGCRTSQPDSDAIEFRAAPTEQQDRGELNNPPSGSSPGPIERDRESFPDFEVGADGPGTDDAYDRLIAELGEAIPDDAGAVPWPDLRNPDPAVAYEGCSVFQNWISEHVPNPELVDGYAAPGSPESKWDRDMFSRQESLDVLAQPSQPPYSLSIVDVVDPGRSPIGDELLAEVPPGSAAVIYFDSVGVTSFVDADGNMVYENDGWASAGPWVAIMEPTEVGWRVWWDELIDVPPGDEWERGPSMRRPAPPKA